MSIGEPLRQTTRVPRKSSTLARRSSSISTLSRSARITITGFLQRYKTDADGTTLLWNDSEFGLRIRKDDSLNCWKRSSATIQHQDNRLGFSQVFVRVNTRCAETSADLKCTECQRPLELHRFGQPLQVQNVSQERVILNISVNLTVYGAGPDLSVGDPNAE